MAPVEVDVVDGKVLWTAAKVMKFLDIQTETTLRATPWVMQLRRAVRPRVYRWDPEEVRAAFLALPKPVLPLTKHTPGKRRKIKQRQQRSKQAMAEFQAELDAKLPAYRGDA